jgi:hypothetical protein
MIISGSVLEEITASKMLSAKMEIPVVSASTLAMLTFFRRLAVSLLGTGVLIKSAALFQAMEHPLTAKIASPMASQTSTSTLASVLAHATSKVQTLIAVAARTGTRRAFKCHLSPTPRNAKTKIQFGARESRALSGG